MKKDVLAQIISSVKEIIGNRKCYNAEYKVLEKEQIKSAISADCYFTDKDDPNWEWINYTRGWLRTHLLKERTQLLDNYHINQSFQFIYKDGSQRLFSAEEILTGQTTHINYSNIAYAHMLTAYEEMDTESGELNYDISEDDQAEAYEAYQTAIEIKYQTAWGKKQVA